VLNACPVTLTFSFRQPDRDRFRLWEVAGTAHADVHLVGPLASSIDCGVPINVLPPPSHLSGFRDTGQDYVFAPGRLDGSKRVHLLVEAMRRTRTTLPLRIANGALLRAIFPHAETAVIADASAYLHVVLPALRGGTAAGATLVFILSFGFFVTPAFLGGPDDLTVATLIDLKFTRELDTAAACAMGSILMVVVLAIYALGTRVLRIDLTRGATR